LERVAEYSKLRLDSELSRFPETFQHRDTLSLLNEVKGLYTKSAEDIVRGIDILNEKGIPYKQSELIGIPKENLAQKRLENLSKTNELINKYKRDGLTLLEMNEAKRLGQDVLDAYSETGKGKIGAKGNLVDLNSSTRQFIEDEAGKRGLTNVADRNRETILAREFKKVVDARQLIGRQRANVIEKMIAIGGITGWAFSGEYKSLLLSGGIIGGIELAKLPRIKTFVANTLSLMTDGEFKQFLSGLEQFPKTSAIGRKILGDAIRYSRYAGEVATIKEQQEQNRIPIRRPQALQ